MARGALLAVVTAVLAAHFRCDDGYLLKYDITKEASSSINKAADTSDQLAELLKQYTNQKAEQCKAELENQNYDDTLQKYVKNMQGQIEYIDKELDLSIKKCGSDSNCKQEELDSSQRDLSALQSKADLFIPTMKKQLLQNQKDYMDKCVQ